MAEGIQHLIDQIQKEGVDKAAKQTEEIIACAKEKAEKTIADAEAAAAEICESAEKKAAAFAERSIRTLEQAARDLLITVGQSCEKIVTSTLNQAVKGAIDGELIRKLIARSVEQTGGNVEIGVSKSDAKALASFCAKLARTSGKEIELKAENEILGGFRIGFKKENAYLDYSSEAIADALAAFLRPELVKIVTRIAREKT